MNGIPAFDASWKDVVGTLYHEMNEFRTDADVGEAIRKNDDSLLGWMGAQGEIGDQPINAAGEAGNLSMVFQEILSSTGGGACRCSSCTLTRSMARKGRSNSPPPRPQSDA